MDHDPFKDRPEFAEATQNQLRGLFDTTAGELIKRGSIKRHENDDIPEFTTELIREDFEDLDAIAGDWQSVKIAYIDRHPDVVESEPDIPANVMFIFTHSFVPPGRHSEVRIEKTIYLAKPVDDPDNVEVIIDTETKDTVHELLTARALSWTAQEYMHQEGLDRLISRIRADETLKPQTGGDKISMQEAEQLKTLSSRII
jgi:hypothetical protein